MQIVSFSEAHNQKNRKVSLSVFLLSYGTGSTIAIIRITISPDEPNSQSLNYAIKTHPTVFACTCTYIPSFCTSVIMHCTCRYWDYTSSKLCTLYFVDIDECKDEEICKEGTYCLNLQGSHKCNSESAPP